MQPTYCFNWHANLANSYKLSMHQGFCTSLLSNSLLSDSVYRVTLCTVTLCGLTDMLEWLGVRLCVLAIGDSLEIYIRTMTINFVY